MGKFQLFPDQASTLAPKIDALYLYLTAVTVFFTVIIFALIVVFGIKYRRKSDDETGRIVHAPIWMEISWAVIPFFLLMVMFGWGAVIFIQQAHAPSNAMEINVTGKQWMWKIQHPDGQREIDQLHVPINQPVKLIMTSQDVIHDFGIPAFRVKQDVLPGRYTTEWFEATKVGQYHIFCDQYCGSEHAEMIGTVTVMEPDKYQAWLSGAIPSKTTAEAGKELFVQYNCVSCHSQQAPTMANVYGKPVKVWRDGKLDTEIADDNYIRESIVYPNAAIVDGYQPLMPSFQGQLTEEQITELVDYIKTLGQQGGRADAYKASNSNSPYNDRPPEWLQGRDAQSSERDRQQ